MWELLLRLVLAWYLLEYKSNRPLLLDFPYQEGCIDAISCQRQDRENLWFFSEILISIIQFSHGKTAWENNLSDSTHSFILLLCLLPICGSRDRRFVIETTITLMGVVTQMIFIRWKFFTPTFRGQHKNVWFICLTHLLRNF